MEPALTPDEWGNEIRAIAPDVERESLSIALRAFLYDPPSVDARTRTEQRHALAAIALHEQPFGFTWKDVDGLRYLAAGIDRQHPGGMNALGIVSDLADRIAALLPPRER